MVNGYVLNRGSRTTEIYEQGCGCAGDKRKQ